MGKRLIGLTHKNLRLLHDEKCTTNKRKIMDLEKIIAISTRTAKLICILYKEVIKLVKKTNSTKR